MIRVVTTFFMAAAVLAGIWYLPLHWVRVLLVAIAGAGLVEYGRLVFKGRGRVFLTLVCGLLIAALTTWWTEFSFFQPELFLALLFLILFAILLVEVFSRDPLEEAIHRAGLVLLGSLYLGATLPIWGWVQSLGREWTMLLLFSACLPDTFGFLAGKAFGRHRMAPVISPNKTWEGALASVAGGIFGFWLAKTLFFGNNLAVGWPLIVLCGGIIGTTAIMGDLIESLLKRGAGVKDSSALIPGHGGALDRLDALIFSAPVFYFALYPLLA